MKALHSLLLTMALGIGILGLTAQARAETAPTPAKSGSHHQGMSQGTSVRHLDRLDGILAQLSLTADQQQQIQTIRQKNAPQRPAAESSQRITAADRQKTRQQQDNEIAKLLTNEQRVKWDQLMAQSAATGTHRAASGQRGKASTGSAATTSSMGTAGH